uniref:SRCR domain-containing protein n=1 Tax=Romanomermis culicivorax TaxID=13658 RepID=A0A915K0I4_ROMCU
YSNIYDISLAWILEKAKRSWTDVDYSVACKSMGFGGGNFWKFFRRNNDTSPFVMPKPGCPDDARNFEECTNFSTNTFMLAENLCQGEDDLGLFCYGPAAFKGWNFHWKGIRFFDAPWTTVSEDPDDVSVKKRSLSSLQHLDIYYAGFDKETMNSTASIYVQGVPPFVNFVDVKYGAGDGVIILDSSAPVEITNCSISFNRGHGIVVENTTDGRLFVNETSVLFNYGNGIQYEPKTGLKYYSSKSNIAHAYFIQHEFDRPEIDACGVFLPKDRLSYSFMVQFLEISVSKATPSKTFIYICADVPENCAHSYQYKIPIFDGIMPPSIEATYISVTNNNHLPYSLNISNSIVRENVGHGLLSKNSRDRIILNNVTVSNNQHIGLHISGGVSDLWINNSVIQGNFNDGINVSYVGGSTVINGSSISNNRLRGAAFHYNDSGLFLPLRQSIIIRGKPSIGPDYKNTNFNYNLWGGLLIGNFCANAYNRVNDPKVILTFVNFIGNEYHPAFEYHSCRRDGQPITSVEISGSICRRSTGFCIRVQPAVNIGLHISDNNFVQNNRGVLIIRNGDHPQLSHLPANVYVTRNQFKFNSGNFIIYVGLNNHSPVQKAWITDQNEVRENKVQNPYPKLTPRNFPYAAVVVSSSNVKLTRNCFNNMQAEYELATDLADHGDTIMAGENNFGSYDFDRFMPKIFDHFKRFTLASINIDPVAAICNAQNPRLTPLFNYFRKFRQYNNPHILGGTIYEPTDLPKGVYTIVDDLHIVPGAVLTLQAGTVFKFADSIGLLVQGEMIRQRDSFSNEENSEPIIFTRLEAPPPKEETPLNIRLVNEDSSLSSTHSAIVGRLEVLLNGEWGVVCNRSWTSNLASLVCNQLGGILDREYYEKWTYFLPRYSTDLPILMDIIRCEEWETDITNCRHDGVEHNINLTCTDIVGVRCVEPHWAGVRYSLLANPPTVVGQTTIRNLIIEKAGLLDAYTPQFCSALQIDWNFHIFQDLIIRDNWWTGIDIVYNDFMRKPRLYNSLITRNRRHGMRLRSVGISMENVTLSENGNAGLLYDSVIPANLQRDIYSWLKNPPMQTFSNIFLITNDQEEKSVNHEIVLTSSVRNRRKFVIVENSDDGIEIRNRSITVNLRIISKNLQTGLGAKIGVQLVGRPNDDRYSDENMIFVDSNKKVIDLKKTLIDFPFVSTLDTLSIEYKRSYGRSTLAVLLFYMDAYEMIDPFIHLRYSSVSGNEYGSNNISSKVEYFIDNCSISLNNGGIVQSHRDLYASTNVFSWKIYRSNFFRNQNFALRIALPNPANYIRNHTIDLTENEFRHNLNFKLKLGGFYSWMNFSSNNFSSNQAKSDGGLLHIWGMEKEMVMERNRFTFNYFEQNYFLANDQPKIEHYPRSYALGIFGVQKVNVSYNNIHNPLFDFELISGLINVNPIVDRLNVTHNYWGPSTHGDLARKIFDFDDWNIFSLADYNPYFVTREKSLNFEWRPQDAQTDIVPYNEPNIDDLKGRLYTSMTLNRRRSQWPTYPWHYKPDIPYRIRSDLTVMPGAVLTIEKGVEIHVCPNVRILILGSLIAQGTADEPIRFKPINITEYDHFCSLHRGAHISKSRLRKRDTVDSRFPILNRYVASLQEFSSHLVLDEGGDERSGFLHIFNATTGEMVPICDRQFSTRNTEVVCRELGFETKNAYFWIGSRLYFSYSWDPKLKIVKSYAEPRQCTGEESRFSDCDLRFTSQRDTWQCMDVKHFVFIHCSPTQNYLDENYVCPWGGLFFSTSIFETSPKDAPKSFLSYVEIVGAGFSHNESSSALTAVYHSLILHNVNVTNSSMHGIQVLSPIDEVELIKLNVTFNKGVGLNVLTTNFPVAESNVGQNEQNDEFSESTSYFANFPYHLFGFLHMCSTQKIVKIQFRGIIFYKYDNFATDCVKIFVSYSPTKQIQFKILKIWLPHVDDDNRIDSLVFYDGIMMTEEKKIAYWNRKDAKVGKALQSKAGALGVHFQGNAADGLFGFFAEVSVVPTPIESRPVHQVRMKECRFENNDRGAIRYANLGENSPDLSLESSFFKNNGYQVWSNFSTSRYAVELDLHGTQTFAVKFCSFWRNQGALNIKIAGPTSYRSRGVIKNCAFGNNENFEILKSTGAVYHKIYVLNNYFGKNKAPYRDLVAIDKIIVNFTRNIFYNNTGSHILHSKDRRSTAHEFQTFLSNFFFENIALGHGYRHQNFDFGYLPSNPDSYTFSTRIRKKRQSNLKANFDWLAYIGPETERYRSTVLVGGTQHYFYANYFNNPRNSFELTTVNKSSEDVYSGPVDAKSNYWGHPGTAAVAQGRIRDQEDYDYLLKVDYEPVLESNTSLMEGFCPPGWFQAGFEEWKSFQSCYLYVPGAMPFHSAMQFCKDQEAYMPFLRDGDQRFFQVASKIFNLNQRFVLPFERYTSESASTDSLIWMSGTGVPSWMCAALSTRTNNVKYHSCELPLPFVCEKGPGLYEESLVLQTAGATALVVSLILLVVIILLICLWYMKSSRRKKEFFERKNSLRSSMRSNRLMILEKAKKQKENEERKTNKYDNVTSPVYLTPATRRAESPDLISQAYRNLVMGRNCETSIHKESPQSPTCPSQSSFRQTKKQNSPSEESACTQSTVCCSSSSITTACESLTPRQPKTSTSAVKCSRQNLSRKFAREICNDSPTTSICNLIDNNCNNVNSMAPKTADKQENLLLVSFRKPPKPVASTNFLNEGSQSSARCSDCFGDQCCSSSNSANSARSSTVTERTVDPYCNYCKRFSSTATSSCCSERTSTASSSCLYGTADDKKLVAVPAKLDGRKTKMATNQMARTNNRLVNDWSTPHLSSFSRETSTMMNSTIRKVTDQNQGPLETAM